MTVDLVVETVVGGVVSRLLVDVVLCFCFLVVTVLGNVVLRVVNV